MRPIWLMILTIVFVIPGCVAYDEELRVWDLHNAGKDREFITAFAEMVNSGQPRTNGFNANYGGWVVSYCDACVAVQDYDRLFRAVTWLEKLVQQGVTIGNMQPCIFKLDGQPEYYRAAAYLGLGKPDAAVRELEESKRKQDFTTLESQLRQRELTIRFLGLYGKALALSGRREAALKTAKDLERVSVVFPYTASAITKQMELAKVYVGIGEFKEGLGAINDIGGLLGMAYMSPIWDQTYNNLPRLYLKGRCEFECGQLNQAKEDYDCVLGNQAIQQLGGVYWLTLYDRARIARKQREFPTATGLLAGAIDVIEEQRATIHSEAGKIGFVGNKQAVYEEIVSLLVEQDKATEAFEYVERSKARALVDLLASQNELTFQREHSPVITETLSRLTQSEKELAIIPDAGDRTSMAKTRGTVLKLKGQIVSEAPELASLISVQGASCRELQRLFGSDETLLEYYSCGSSWYVFAMTRGSMKVRKLPESDVGAAVAEFRRKVADATSTDYLACAQRLFAAMIGPIKDSIRGANVIIVPHGPLHYLPFAALHDGQEYLIDRFSVRILPSATVLKFLKSARIDPARGVLAIGNPSLRDSRLDLKYAEAEAKAVVAAMGIGRVLVREDATETAVKTLLGQYGILHFATHGIFNPMAPLESRLLLGSDRQGEGALTVRELYSVRLDADLVTLSGCDTGVGQVGNGDDVIGFTRGLLYAGARSIVSTLWEVDDEATKNLMVTFYQNLRNRPQRDALRTAQRKMKELKPHPYFWAGFQLTGDSGAS